MAVRISIVVLVVAILFLVETFLTGTPGPNASHLSELFLPPGAHRSAE